MTAGGPSCFSSAFAGTASAQGEVTAGGTVEIIAGNSDHDSGVQGFDDLYSRLFVNYATELDNGLKVSSRVSVFASDDAIRGYSPGDVYVSVGSSFGTVTMGHHAMATHATLPFVFQVPSFAWWHWGLFSGLVEDDLISNGAWHYVNFGTTPAAISYATPSMGGLTAMVTYAPNAGADQTNSIKTAIEDDGAEDYLAGAIKYSGGMGGATIDLGASFQTASDDAVDSIAMSGIVGFGPATLAAAWHDNGDMGTQGWVLSAKYALGNISPGVSYNQLENENGGDETALILGVNYAVGGGLSVFAEYMAIDVENDTAEMSGEETILVSGATISF